MKIPAVGEGIAFGIGGTNYRVAFCDTDGAVGETFVSATPDTPDEFFRQTAKRLLDAADQGATWGVTGNPGPVVAKVDPETGAPTQNIRVTNITALSDKRGFDPVKEMIKADSAVADLLETGFTFRAVNDGDLAAHAAAHVFANGPEEQYDVVADLINGTGTGGAITRRDQHFPGQNLFHSDPGLWEIGHLPLLPGFPSLSYESTISGTAIGVRSGEIAEKLAEDDPLWDEVGQGLGSLILNFAINGGAELVVVSGGIGIHRQTAYYDKLNRMIDRFARSNNPMADKMPDLVVVPPDMADTYELHGAHSAIRSHLILQAIDGLIRSAEA